MSRGIAATRHVTVAAHLEAEAVALVQRLAVDLLYVDALVLGHVAQRAAVEAVVHLRDGAHHVTSQLHCRVLQHTDKLITTNARLKH